MFLLDCDVCAVATTVNSKSGQNVLQWLPKPFVAGEHVGGNLNQVMVHRLDA